MLTQDPASLLESANPESIDKVKITAYEPAFGIIGDPAKRSPKTRQSADHSMVYIIATLLRKAFERKDAIIANHDIDEVWKSLMLSPIDYGKAAIANEQTKRIMEKIEFHHGGPDYDSKYPEGIPTSIEITTKKGKVLDSGLVMYPGGHSRNT
jgi:2-methylcitrate dehydratase